MPAEDQMFILSAQWQAWTLIGDEPISQAASVSHQHPMNQSIVPPNFHAGTKPGCVIGNIRPKVAPDNDCIQIQSRQWQ